MKKLLASFAFIIFISLAGYSQNYEKVVFDASDSTGGYYLAVNPYYTNIKGVIVLLVSFRSPESILPETKLHNVAFANGILTVVASVKDRLYADETAVKWINAIIKSVIGKYAVDTAKFSIAGFDLAGMVALRYAELTYEHPLAFPVHPKAVFAIDSPVDLFGLWHWSERQLKKNYYPGSIGDARAIMGIMAREYGTIYSAPDKYRGLTAFYKDSDTAGNEQFLNRVAVRLYYDTDIEWQLKNRRNSYYDTNIPDGSEMIERLLMAGNSSAELIASTQPGTRSNGLRNPNSISIVDEAECVQWLKHKLDIFDPYSWTPPYKLSVPKGWGIEHFELPPDFAPKLTRKGTEDLRFSPGWGDAKTEDYWSYAYLWWLKGQPAINAEALQQDLETLYTGLVGRNLVLRKIPEKLMVPVKVELKKIKTGAGDDATFAGTVKMSDYMSQTPITLNCTIHLLTLKEQEHTAVFFEISPKQPGSAIWSQLDKIRESFELEE